LLTTDVLIAGRIPGQLHFSANALIVVFMFSEYTISASAVIGNLPLLLLR
jgi:hypothetical protein